MAIPQGTLGLPQLALKPSAPAVGTVIIYTKTDDVLYLQDSSGAEVPFGSASSVTSLVGDVSGTGPGAAVTTVNSVGGYSASAIAASVAATQSAVSINTASTIVKRDSSGNFAAGTITANLTGNVTGNLTGNVTGNLTGNVTGNVSGSAASFTGSLAGDVTGTQSATVVSLVGGQAAATVASATVTVGAATSLNTVGTLVKRDGGGSFSAGTITATFVGNVTGNVSGSAASFTGSLAGDVTGTQSATVVQKIQGTTVSNSTPTDAQIFIFNSTSNQWNPISISGDVALTHSGATSIASTTVTGKLLTGYSVGTNSPITATDSILLAFEKIQGQLNATSSSAITALIGDVVATGPGSVSATIQANVVTNSKLAQAPANTLKGNNTGSTANVTDLTVSQVNTMLGTVTIVGTFDSQSPSANGLVISGNDIYAQSASASNPGMVNTTTQTFAGTKTFSTVIVTALQSVSANPAASGIIRLANADAIAWRNTGNSADILLQPDANGILQYGTVDLVNISASQTLTNKTIAAGSNTITGLTNANLSGSAGITGANIASNTVTNTNLAQMAANTVKANTGGAPANPVDTALGTLMEVTSSILTLVGWGDATIGSPTIQVAQSSTSVSGYLSSTDWNTFNNKQPAGNYITGLMNDVTASGPGSAAATVVAIQGHSISSTAPTDAQLLLWVNGTSKWTPASMSADATISDSGALTLATVNSNVGSFGSSTAIPVFTVNAKGLITAASTTSVVAPAGTLTGTTLASNVVNSSLQNLGIQNATLNMGNNVINNATCIEIGTTSASSGGLIVANATNFNSASATGIDYSGGSARVISWGPTTSTYSPITFLQVTSNSSANRTPIYISAAGQVGIGNNTNPSYALDVSGTFATDSHSIFTDGSGNMTLNSLTVNVNIGGSKWEIFGTDGHISFDNATITSNGSGVLTVADLVVTASSTTAIKVNTSSFVFDSVNNCLGIGQAPITTTIMTGVNTSGAAKPIQLIGYGTGSSTGLRGDFARGTSLAPTATQSGDILNFISGRGYGASQFAPSSTGVIQIAAGEAFTNTSNATYIAFKTTPTGSITSAERMRINSTGNILIGTTTDNASDLVQVNGSVNALTFIVSGTAGAGYGQFNSQSVAPATPTSALRLYADSTSRLSWIGPNGFSRTFDGTANTANRVYTLPDTSDYIATAQMIQAFKTAVVSLSFGTNVATNAALGNIFTLTLTGTANISAPTNPINGQKITYRISQDATGGRVLTFDPIFNFGNSVYAQTLTASKTDYIGCIYNSATVKWDVVAFSRGF
jgi:hypothetical protein